jgi:hypothetical protein
VETKTFREYIFNTTNQIDVSVDWLD